MANPNPERAKSIQKMLNAINSRNIMQVGQEFFDQFEVISKKYLSQGEVTERECDQIRIELTQVQENLSWANIGLIIWELAHRTLPFPVWSDLQTRQQEILILQEGIQVFLKDTLQPKS